MRVRRVTSSTCPRPRSSRSALAALGRPRGRPGSRGARSFRARSFATRTSSIEATGTVRALTSIGVARSKYASSICPPAGRKYQVDQDVAVEGLEEPVLGDRLGSHARGDQRLEGSLGVSGPDEDIHVVIRWRAAACPDREPASDQELHVGLAQRRGDTLHRVQQVVEVLRRCRGHGHGELPASPVDGTLGQRVSGSRGGHSRSRGRRRACGGAAPRTPAWSFLGRGGERRCDPARGRPHDALASPTRLPCSRTCAVP